MYEPYDFDVYLTRLPAVPDTQMSTHENWHADMGDRYVSFETAPKCEPLVWDQLSARTKYRQAALRVKNLFPGPLGEFVSHELLFAEHSAKWIAPNSLVDNLVEWINAKDK